MLYERLKKGDPKTASSLHPNDLFRIVRALEVLDSTGVPISFYREQHRFGEKPYMTVKIGLQTNRDLLFRRIDERVDQMLEKGLLREIEGLLGMGYGPELKPMQSLGYKQIIQYLLKEIGLDEAVQQIKRKTHHYAKRQFTWFKADPEIRWRDGLADRKKIFHEIRSFWEGEGKA